MMKRSEGNICLPRDIKRSEGSSDCRVAVLKSKLLKTVAQYIFRKVYSPSIFVMMHAEFCFQKWRNKE